jgi:predicted nucleic acid-binding protein
MKERYFLDTNVLVYLLDDKEPIKFARSQKLVREALKTRNGVISYQVVQDFVSVAIRKFSTPLTPVDLRQFYSSTLRPLVAIDSSPALFSTALDIVERYKLSWYDLLIVAAASKPKCSILYSEILQAGLTIGSMRIVSPFVT